MYHVPCAVLRTLLCTVYHVPYTVYHVPCAVYHTLQCTVYHIILSTVCDVPCTVDHILLCSKYHVPCTMYHAILCTVYYAILCTVYHLPCTVYHSIHCVLCTFLCTPQVGAKELPERALKLTAYDVDRDRKHNIIGHVIHYFKVTSSVTSSTTSR